MHAFSVPPHPPHLPPSLPPLIPPASDTTRHHPRSHPPPTNTAGVAPAAPRHRQHRLPYRTTTTTSSSYRASRDTSTLPRSMPLPLYHVLAAAARARVVRAPPPDAARGFSLFLGPEPRRRIPRPRSSSRLSVTASDQSRLVGFEHVAFPALSALGCQTPPSQLVKIVRPSSKRPPDTRHVSVAGCCRMRRLRAARARPRRSPRPRSTTPGASPR